MSGVERIARWIVAALVVGVMPLVAWSGGCSSSHLVVQPMGGHGGSAGAGGTTGTGGTTGRGGTGGTAGGGGTSGNPDAGSMCCSPDQFGLQRCSADQRQLTICYMRTNTGCGNPPGGYAWAFNVQRDCPDGCVVTDAGADANDYCLGDPPPGGVGGTGGSAGAGGTAGGGGRGGSGGTGGGNPDAGSMCCSQDQILAVRCSVDRQQLTTCLYSPTAFSAGCPPDPSPGSYGYVFVVQGTCPNGCVVTDAGADANDYCRD